MSKKILITIGILIIAVTLFGKYPQESELGNIHDPSIDELALEELFGIPRHNNWFSFVGKGDDQNLYGLYGNFQYHYGRKASIIVKRFPDNEIICHLSFDWRKESGKRFDGEKIVYWAPSSLEEDYIKYTIHDNSYELEANCGSTYINLVFQKEVSFWYNKARPAEVYPDCEIAGIEEVSKATGYLLTEGKRINLTGLGHSEHFFNKGNIVQKIKEYGNEWWMPFRFDEVQGIFVVFGDYRDAGLLIDGEYIIPSSFDYFVDKENRKIRIVADTPKGTLDIIHHIFGNIGAEYLATSTGKLDGRELTNGFGWIEHVNSHKLIVKPETIKEKVKEKLLNLEREIKAKANELYLTETYLLYKKAKNFYLKGDYKNAEFAVNKAFESLKNADKLDLALSHSHINDRPKFEDELPREYPTFPEWYFMGGNARDEKGNYFSFWFSQTQTMATVFVGINNETLFDFKKEAKRKVEIKDDVIIISSNFQDGFLRMRIHQDKRNLEFSYDGYKIILNTISRGIPLWHGKEKGQMVGFAEYMHFGGFDDPVEIKGIMEKDGRRIYEFEGYGDYEHSWADLPRTESYETWICVNTPEFYGIFLLTASCDKKTIFGKSGRIGFTLTNESFRADEFEVVDLEYPRIIKLRGKFKEGEFEITMKSYYLQSPGWIIKHPYMLVEGKVIKGNSTMKLKGYGFLELGRCFTSDDPLAQKKSKTKVTSN